MRIAAAYGHVAAMQWLKDHGAVKGCDFLCCVYDFRALPSQAPKLTSNLARRARFPCPVPRPRTRHARNGCLTTVCCWSYRVSVFGSLFAPVSLTSAGSCFTDRGRHRRQRTRRKPRRRHTLVQSRNEDSEDHSSSRSESNRRCCRCSPDLALLDVASAVVTGGASTTATPHG